MSIEFEIKVGINTKSDKTFIDARESFGKKKSVFILTRRDSGAPRASKVQTYYKGVSEESLHYETLDTDVNAVDCITVSESFSNKKRHLMNKSLTSDIVKENRLNWFKIQNAYLPLCTIINFFSLNFMYTHGKESTHITLF